MLNCIVVDDDEVFLEIIKMFVNEHPDLRLVGHYCNVADAKRGLEQLKVDLVFLDIEMPTTTGIEFIQSGEQLPQVILVSAHKEYALEAFEYDVTDYLLKPINEERFNRAVQRAKTVNDYQKFDTKKSHVYFKVNNNTVKVKLDDIKLIESYGDYLKLYERDNRHIILGTLNRMQQTLDTDQFMRVHRKFIVRLASIREVNGNVAIIDDSLSAQISRTTKAELFQRLSDLRD